MFYSKISIPKIIFFVLIIILLFSLTQFNAYDGIVHDENTQLRATHIHLAAGINFLLGKDPDVFNEKGIIQKLPAVIFSIISTIIKKPFLIFEPGKIVDEYQLYYYNLSHCFAVLYSLGTCYLILDIGKKVKIQNYWLAPVFLLSTPVFFGHSIFNIKDIPLAFFYSLTTWSILKLSSDFKKGFISNKWILISSIIIGVTSSLKFVIYPALIFQLIITLFFIKARKIKTFNFIINILKIIFLSIFVVVFTIPASWSHPINFLIEAFNKFSNFPWNSCDFFRGQCIGISSENWSLLRYLINWFSLKLTFINFFSIFSAIFILIKILLKIKNKYEFSIRDSIRVGFLSQLLIIPILAILNNGNSYNGIRHYLFIFPSLAFLASDTIETTFYHLKSKLIKQFLVFLFSISILLNIIDIISLSPYQYVYFNEIFRNESITNTEIDYWAASIGELYEKSRSKTDFFPNSPKFIRRFVEINKLKTLESANNLSAKVNYRVGKYSKDKEECNEIYSVKRKYPVTETEIRLSELMVCNN